MCATKPYAYALWRWSQVLARRGYDVPYRLHGLPGYMEAAVMALIKNKRCRPTPGERQRVLEKHGHRCAQCGDPGDDYGNILELDHPAPLRDGGRDGQEKVPLCPNCHGHKSYLESLTPFQANPSRASSSRPPTRPSTSRPNRGQPSSNCALRRRAVGPWKSTSAAAGARA